MRKMPSITVKRVKFIEASNKKLTFISSKSKKTYNANKRFLNYLNFNEFVVNKYFKYW